MWQLLEASKGGAGFAQLEAKVDEIDEYERALSAVRTLAANLELDVSAAKMWLRTWGVEGGRCASLLSKISAMRNRQAHPLGHQFLQLLGCLRWTWRPNKNVTS